MSAYNDKKDCCSKNKVEDFKTSTLVDQTHGSQETRHEKSFVLVFVLLVMETLLNAEVKMAEAEMF